MLDLGIFPTIPFSPHKSPERSHVISPFEPVAQCATTARLEKDCALSFQDAESAQEIFSELCTLLLEMMENVCLGYIFMGIFPYIARAYASYCKIL
jgi:hypothetical protein